MSETLDHTFRDWYKKTDIVTSEFSSLKWQDEKNHVFLDAMSCQLAEASIITLSYKSISSAVLLRMWDTAHNSDKYIKDEKKYWIDTEEIVLKMKKEAQKNRLIQFHETKS